MRQRKLWFNLRRDIPTAGTYLLLQDSMLLCTALPFCLFVFWFPVPRSPQLSNLPLSCLTGEIHI